MGEFAVEAWGSGDRVVLVHGDLATGPEVWGAQRPLAEEGFELVVPTRGPYAAPARDQGQDFRAEAEELRPLLADEAHLVGHSTGAIVALLIAAQWPESVRSLALAEPPLFDVAADQPDVAELRERLEGIFHEELTNREFVEALLANVGSPLDEMPPGVLDEVAGMAPAVRLGDRPWDIDLPLELVAAASFPVLVVSGNHHPAFTAIAEALADQLDARHTIVEGAGHEMQTLAEGFNPALLSLWRGATDRT
jgi:pimeloyl-ACP methyl ester carboxylesterase